MRCFHFQDASAYSQDFISLPRYFPKGQICSLFSLKNLKAQHKNNNTKPQPIDVVLFLQLRDPGTQGTAL